MTHGLLVLECLVLAFLFVRALSMKSKAGWVPALIAAQGVAVLYLDLAGGLPKAAAPLAVDHLGVLLLVVAGVVGGLVALYAISYMKEEQAHRPERPDRRGVFFFLIFLFLCAMAGIALSNSLAWLFFFWEITTLCSYLLIRARGDEASVRNSDLALALNVLGGAFFAAGLMWLALGPGPKTGELQALVASGRAALPVAVLLGLAGLVKSAQLPFHQWLLGAMVAPTPVSALLHASTMVKAGVFLLLRFSPVYQDTLAGGLLAGVGAAAFVAASLLAVAERDAKRVLAYSTIANLGLIVACAGIGGRDALWAGMLLMVFHAVAKGLLFLAVGSAEHRLGSRDIEDMQGLLQRQRVLGSHDGGRHPGDVPRAFRHVDRQVEGLGGHGRVDADHRHCGGLWLGPDPVLLGQVAGRGGGHACGAQASAGTHSLRGAGRPGRAGGPDPGGHRGRAGPLPPDGGALSGPALPGWPLPMDLAPLAVILCIALGHPGSCRCSSPEAGAGAASARLTWRAPTPDTVLSTPCTSPRRPACTTTTSALSCIRPSLAASPFGRAAPWPWPPWPRGSGHDAAAWAQLAYLVLAPVASCLLAGLGPHRHGPHAAAPRAAPAAALLRPAETDGQAGRRDQPLPGLLPGRLPGLHGGGRALFFGGGDLLLVVFALTLGAIMLVLAAFSAHSPYAHLGAHRELLQMLAYEPMLLLTALGLYLATHSFGVAEIAATAKAPLLVLPGVFVGYLFILTIKLRKSPFDLSSAHHAHQELVRGLTVEISGGHLALVELAHWYENVLLLGILYLFLAPFGVGLALAGVAL